LMGVAHGPLRRRHSAEKAVVDPNFFASVRAQLVATDGRRTAGT
jgi:hypothetical protein